MLIGTFTATYVRRDGCVKYSNVEDVLFMFVYTLTASSSIQPFLHLLKIIMHVMYNSQVLCTSSGLGVHKHSYVLSDACIPTQYTHVHYK